MCYTAQLDTGGLFPFSFESIARWESVESFPNFLRRSAAARPTVPVVASEDRTRFQPMRWLLVPPWITTGEEAKTLKIWTANARIEELERKRLYRTLTAKNRCVVLITGFYEWRHEEDGTKTRYLLKLPDGEPMLLPGLYVRGTIDGAPSETCTVCTMEARGIMRYIHNSNLRQPVVLDRTGIEAWLDPTCSFEDARRDVLHRERSDSFVPDPEVPGVPDSPNRGDDSPNGQLSLL